MTIPAKHNRAFVGCSHHETFNYYCHPCLVQTIGKLCEILDEKEETSKRQFSNKFRVGFIDSGGRKHVHLEEFIDNKLVSDTIDTSMCPTCGVSNGTD